MAEQTFKVGDKVRVLAGGRGVITYGPVNSTFDTYKMFVVKQDGDGERAFKASDLATLDRFEIGDQVVSLHFEGTRTVVAGPFRACLGDDFYVIKNADEEHSVLHADSLRPLVLTPTAGIKVGDRVRVLRAKWGEEQHGKVGTVLSVTETFRDRENDLHPYDIELDDGGTIYAAEVEPVPATVTYDGVEYSLTAEYRDNEGDFWKFAEEQTEEGGNARLHYRGKFSGSYAAGTDALSYVVDAWGPLTEI
ncbi:phiSA1p31-related protein [Streptomyces sp. CBG33]|uniref:phiSA1p31-related protein n=1 Tax=Streptomyces sp. CBG33 TaxID=2762624 RepID=UPI001644F781|nr:phiSA1p31-related protein [Streptomyces sp. CBG33]